MYSVTSWTELARDGAARNKARIHNPDQDPGEAFATTQLKQTEGPYIATSDFTTDLQEQIRPYVPGRYVVLGADGFGFSDTREAARRYFNIDAESMVVAALTALADEGKLDISIAAQAAKDLLVDDPTDAAPTHSGSDQGEENAVE